MFCKNPCTKPCYRKEVFKIMIWSLNLVFNPFPNDKFRLFQTERVCRRQFQIWWQLNNALQTGKKHCGKKKLLVMSNFSFSHKVFKRLVLQTRKKQGLFGKGSVLLVEWKLSKGTNKHNSLLACCLFDTDCFVKVKFLVLKCLLLICDWIMKVVTVI